MIARHGKILTVLAIVVAGAIMIHRFSPNNWPTLAIDIMHSLHGTGFALLAVAVWWLLQRKYPGSFNYLLAAGITMSIGVISEVAQIPGPRDAQFSDLLVDGMGIFGALGVLAAIDRSVRKQLARHTRILLPSVAGMALGIACVPTAWLSYALIKQYAAVPEIVTFEHLWERATFGQTADSRPAVVPAPDNWPNHRGSVALAKEDGRWGILISVHPIPDWRGYSSVSFVVASTGAPFKLGVGIKDMKKNGEYHGVRFYKTVPVDDIPKRIEVTFDEIRARDSERAFDFSLVEAIVLSADSPGDGAEVLVDDFRLEK